MNSPDAGTVLYLWILHSHLTSLLHMIVSVPLNSSPNTDSPSPGRRGTSPLVTSIRRTWPPERVLRKCPCERLLAADFLAANEGVNGDSDGAIDVLRRDVFGQPHFAEGFCDAHNSFEMTDLRAMSQ